VKPPRVPVSLERVTRSIAPVCVRANAGSRKETLRPSSLTGDHAAGHTRCRPPALPRFTAVMSAPNGVADRRFHSVLPGESCSMRYEVSLETSLPTTG
jgi:hypothetical protein